MASTVFQDYVTPVVASWLNDVNTVVYTTSLTYGLKANPLSQFAATTSAQLAGVVTDETGTGVLVFNNSPALITPALGTPSSGDLTNCTGTAAGLSIGGNAATATNVNGYTAAVASADTTDIWTGTGAVVQVTGTATITGFGTAPSIGATKKLITTGACLITAGANLIIEGIPSGNTITLAANAIINVIAITTTQFKMTYSLSNTFTAGCTGLASTPTVTATYRVKNGLVSLSIPYGLSGVSNLATFTITGLPPPIYSASSKIMPLIPVKDNSSATFGGAYTSTSSLVLYKGYDSTVSNSWTNSGVKGLLASEFNYAIA